MHATCPLRVYNNNSVVYTRAYNARIYMARVKINVLATYNNYYIIIIMSCIRTYQSLGAASLATCCCKFQLNYKQRTNRLY